MKSHLQRLIVVLVVHVVDGIHDRNVKLCQPFHAFFKSLNNIVILKRSLRNSRKLWSNLSSRLFIATTIQSIQQEFGHVTARTKQLHLFSSYHSTNTTRNRYVITAQTGVITHQSFVFVLQTAGCARHLSAIYFEVLRQAFSVPKNGNVRFRGRSQVGQRVNNTVSSLGDKMSAPITLAASDRSSHPGGITGKNFIVSSRAQMPDETQFHYEMVNDLLRLGFSKGPSFKFKLEIYV
mmetsp:Transcript_3111/g.4183  ORF Transcript_3111/g.4183 Transcript_3111/m.4183 type:complete len:236 (+) Transcript_3111:909-1616(+)